MKGSPKASNIAACGRLNLTRALRQLREQAREMGDYSPVRPQVELKDGTHLELTLKKSVGGGELLGCWVIYRYWSDGKRATYPV